MWYCPIIFFPLRINVLLIRFLKVRNSKVYLKKCINTCIIHLLYVKLLTNIRISFYFKCCTWHKSKQFVYSDSFLNSTNIFSFKEQFNTYRCGTNQIRIQVLLESYYYSLGNYLMLYFIDIARIIIRRRCNIIKGIFLTITLNLLQQSFITCICISRFFEILRLPPQFLVIKIYP